MDTADLVEWVGANNGDDGQFEDLDDANYNSDGRKGIIKGKIDTSDF